MTFDPEQYEWQKELLVSQVKALLNKYHDDSAAAISALPKALDLYDTKLRLYDDPIQAREDVVRWASKWLSGKPATYEDISDSRVALGDQSWVRDLGPGYLSSLG